MATRPHPKICNLQLGQLGPFPGKVLNLTAGPG